MEVSSNNKISGIFIVAALVLLGVGMLFGVIGGVQYMIPGFLKDSFSFEKARPLHVSAILFWIILAASGALFTYLPKHTGKKIWSPLLQKIQLGLLLFTVLAIFISYFMGWFGGREYWEFPPILSLPITLAWILFIINFVKSLGGFSKQPVYVWMWMTGLLFFLFTYLESNLWLIPYFRSNIINDMTIQWKSYGSMVGAWNMLIYGSSIYLLDKIGGTNYGRSGMAFGMYFLGMYNLMFNWGHHIYTLPTYGWLKQISYFVSMTELFILGRIIYEWKKTLSVANRLGNHETYRFILAADSWIFLNLVLAILMSVPGINVYTHGTHITVAHAMGTTIGINSFLLLAFAHDIFSGDQYSYHYHPKGFNLGFWLANVSLLAFWLSLILSGILKAKWQMTPDAERIPFGEMMIKMKPLFVVFGVSGMVLMMGLLILVVNLVRNSKRV
ncbi:MAG: cbb3-type cytochrome c oxidase subunit I [Chitinophagaceae bacterium]|nr:cbb3-type cytochrome c oxidase subunit I [Chitinophagaceae bacterium]